jgi:ElaB/YqjD/DUF883 family membrane-anchored ribosome-binding protein
VADTVAAARDSASSGVQNARDMMDTGRDRLQTDLDAGKEGLTALSDKASGVARETQQSVAGLIHEQPILMAAIAAAVGAAIGAIFPISRTEKDFFGATGAEAVGAGREALSRAGSVMRQELSGADIGGRVSDIADKMVQEVVGKTSGSDHPA